MKQKLPIPLITVIITTWTTGLILWYVMKKKAGRNAKPSKKAPQLDIENPGIQSDFITTATETEVG